MRSVRVDRGSHFGANIFNRQIVRGGASELQKKSSMVQQRFVKSNFIDHGFRQKNCNNFANTNLSPMSKEDIDASYMSQHTTVFHDHKNHDDTPSVFPSKPKHISPIQQYPLVEGLQFDTSHFRDPHLMRLEGNSRISQRSRKSEISNKPPLQYETNKANLFNFLDGLVNGQWSMNYVKQNDGITPKRQLSQWEKETSSAFK